MAFITVSNKEWSDLLFEELISSIVAESCWRLFISGWQALHYYCYENPDEQPGLCHVPLWPSVLLHGDALSDHRVVDFGWSFHGL
jgi:hypothetical protein